MPKLDSLFIPLYLKLIILEDIKTKSALDIIKVNLDFKANRGLVILIYIIIGQKLKLEVYNYKERYQGIKFIINYNNFIEYIEPNKIDDFFYRFNYIVQLSNR